MVRTVSMALGLVCGLLVSASDAQRAPDPSLAPVEDVEGLPRVLLIGDSISMGYTIPVRKRLEGKANLHRIPVNGGPTSRGVENIDKWLGDSKWDVIHINFGLHDIVPFPDRPHQVEIGDYEKNLRTIFEKATATGAKVVWCSTTPVPDPVDNPKRKSADVIAYNEVAAKVAEEFKLPVDDLYSYALPHLDEWQRPANVHFTATGSEALADQVAKVIIEALAPQGE